MSYCLHYCEEYKVRHSRNCIANWQQEKINNVLKSLTEYNNGNFWFSDESIDYSDRIEIGKDTLKDIIRQLYCAGDEWGDVKLPEDDNEYLQPMLSQLGQEDITPCKLADFLSDALLNSEPTLDYVRFEWL